jgi:transposase
MDSLLPPEEFIRSVLHLYYNQQWLVSTIAEHFDVGVDVINRIIKQYQPTNEPPKYFIEDKHAQKKTKVKEMDDAVRQEKEKLTLEDKEDLELDIKLFERGHEPDAGPEEK